MCMFSVWRISLRIQLCVLITPFQLDESPINESSSHGITKCLRLGLLDHVSQDRPEPKQIGQSKIDLIRTTIKQQEVS